jgi:hypothetical protein
MHETRRTGVRFVLTNPSDPGRLEDFTGWYDTYAAALTVPGYLANAFRFENRDGSLGRGSPLYATIYDIVTSDPAAAWPGTENSPGYPALLFTDPRAKLVEPALRASYALVGSQDRPGGHGPLTGIHVLLSNGGDDTGRHQREARVLRTGLFYAAARFRIIEGSPEPAEWLEVFETDARDVLGAYARATGDTPAPAEIQTELSRSFRLAHVFTATGRGAA